MHCSGMKHTYMGNVFVITNPINTNLIHFIPVHNVLSHTGRSGLSLFRCLKCHSFAWFFRCFASPFRCFVVSHFRPFVVSHRPFAVSSRPFIVLHGLFVLSPSRCFSISLFRCFAVSLFAHSLFHNLDLSLFRTLVVSTANILYLFCFALSLFRTFVVSNSDVMVNATVCRAGIYFSTKTLM